MLTELDRLVQLLESPIFTPLRMEVCSICILIVFVCICNCICNAVQCAVFLQRDLCGSVPICDHHCIQFPFVTIIVFIQLLDNDQDLISALYGLLMLLPQVDVMS